MKLAKIYKSILKESSPATKEPEVKPAPRTKPNETPTKNPIRRPLTPPKTVPKTNPKAEGMGMNTNSWDKIEDEVYKRVQELFVEMHQKFGVDKADYNEMIVNSIRRRSSNSLREEEKGKPAIIDKITQRYKSLKK